MIDAIKKVPAENRWAVASKTMTGAIMATNKVILDIVGREKYNEFMEKIWSEGGKASKQIADTLGMNGKDAKSIADTVQGVATVEMGPEFKFVIVEATEEKATLRCTECPWLNRAKELGISDDMCSLADQAYANGFAKTINPKMKVTIIKAMPRGDAHCEWIYELEK